MNLGTWFMECHKGLLPMSDPRCSFNPDDLFAGVPVIKPPCRSKRQCYMFGCDPKEPYGMVYNPLEGKEPNWFVRLMMKIFFACTWVKEDE